MYVQEISHQYFISMSFFFLLKEIISTEWKIKFIINKSIMYFDTLRQRAKKLVQNTNVYK